jgi:adenylate cyclase
MSARVDSSRSTPTEQAEALWPYTAGRRIDKIRHRVALDEPSGRIAEVDICAGTLAGLCVAEVEFGSEIDAAAFSPPDWFGRELTNEPGWTNAALARYGRPK